MAWVTPKTNWAIHYDQNGNYTGDYFNVSDYERITGNVLYLQALAESVYHIPIPLQTMPDVTYESYGYASYVDAIERNIEAIADHSFTPDGFPAMKSWSGNDPTPNYDDWNRIESATSMLYNTLTQTQAALAKLPVNLGLEEF